MMSRNVFRRSLERGSLQLLGPEFSKHNPYMMRASIDASVVDGIAAERTIECVELCHDDWRWRTGINWHFNLNSDGSWIIHNQGLPDLILGGYGTNVRLMPEKMKTCESFVHWLIYFDSAKNKVAMRPKDGDWLCYDGDTLSCRAIEKTLPESCFWSLEVVNDPVEAAIDQATHRDPPVIKALQRVKRLFVSSATDGQSQCGQ